MRLQKNPFNPNDSSSDAEDAGHEYTDKIKSNLIFSLSLVLIIFIVAAVFYHYYEKWSYLDSAYFISATLTTVGYGDLYPKTDEGKIFTIFLIWFGISVGFFLLYSIAAYRETIVDRTLGQKLQFFKGVKRLARVYKKE